MTTQEITLHIQQENGDIKDVTVSKNFMELCFKNATNIVDKIPNEIQSSQDILKAIEELSSDNNTRSIIYGMVDDILGEKTQQLLFKHMMRGTLIELLQEVLGK